MQDGIFLGTSEMPLENVLEGLNKTECKVVNNFKHCLRCTTKN